MEDIKRFFDIFKKYTPSTSDKRALLEKAKQCTARYQKDPMRVEVTLEFDDLVNQNTLYAIEEECRTLYSAASFRIFPHYPASLFSSECMPEIAEEAERVGGATPGFFYGARYHVTDDLVKIEIPFLQAGVGIVRDTGTETIISNIIFSRFGLRVKVQVVEAKDAAEKTARRLEDQRKMEEEYDRQAIEASKRERKKVGEGAASVEDERPKLPRVTGLIDQIHQFETIDSTTFSCGCYLYDTRNPEFVMGDPFTISEPTAIGMISGTKTNAVVLGTVFSITSKENRAGDRITVHVGITDGASSIFVKSIGDFVETSWQKSLKEGDHIAVSGRIIIDRFDDEPVVQPRGIAKIEKILRTDDAPEKRVELHLHTTMSTMDALIRPDELLSLASKWGHKAIAITDHGNVQAFPEILKMKRKTKSDIKILYGMEAYFVNDNARAIYGSDTPSFDAEMVVFDLETTGLNAQHDRIIEIGAVLIQNGEVKDTYQTFVNPHTPISEEITALTSITDDMVADAPSIEEALPDFLAFVGDRMLIAHNANFDAGFVRAAAERLGIPFTNTYLDTFALSRYVNPELNRHKLDIIAEHYGLGDFHHHRASDDAAMLAHIFFRMQQRLRDEGVPSFDALNNIMSEKADPLKLPTYHMIIFARNLTGLKNLYTLVSESYLSYYRRFPRIPKSLLEHHREGLLIGSACEAGELYRAILDNMAENDIEEIADFYDYLEIQPLCNNQFLIDSQKVSDLEALKDINRKIVALGKKLGKPVVATCDAHFISREEELFRKVLLKGMKMSDADKDVGIYLRTTDEMLDECRYLGEEEAYRVVVKNTNLIADMIEDILPIPDGVYTPSIPGADEDLKKMCYERAHQWYGDPLPELVEKRLDRELSSIITHGFAVLYMIAQKLVSYSESLGYSVGSRGSVGSSFVASMAGISEVNPLPPHYRCPNCKYSEFFLDGSVGSGFDLPDKNCPHCGTLMLNDGHDIPFETFLGFHGDKSPDIDLNFSGDVQGRVHKYTEELFGEGHVFRAGTIGTLASKTAYGFIMKYLEDKGVSLPRAHVEYMDSRQVGVKRTTGPHPGGIIVVPTEYSIYDFSPVQHPADDPNSDIVTTHFQFSYLHDTILKLDELGHDMPTKYKMLERYTNTSVLDVNMNDKAIYDLFASPAPLGVTEQDIGCPLGTWGLPELGTHFIIGVLQDAKPKNFADLLQISGLTHGTDVWLGNAKDLILDGTCTISEVVGTRDSIMLTMIRYGLEPSMAFSIMEDVRKGKGLKPEQEAAMREHDVPDWYIGSCKKIKYMFPKAHAAAYVMSAIRLAWYKIHYPMEFYAAYLSVAPGGFDAEVVMGGKRQVKDLIAELEKKGTDATQKEAEQLTCMQLVYEAMMRGVRFLPPDLYKSDAKYYLPEDGKIRMPFSSLSGVGDTAAQKIAEAREAGEIYSIEDLRARAGLSKTVIETLRRGGVLDKLSETNQMDIFSFFH
ncbi:MAG: PolC-type DNA polymerase III [Clostridia bacterium]|nr:PolC-type DNA polymerase III [Clostridia bacterium]